MAILHPQRAPRAIRRRVGLQWLFEIFFHSNSIWKRQLTGPSWKVAFKDGEPTAAAQAFAKKAGVELAALTRITTPKGEYVSATVQRPGRAAGDVLLEQLPKEIAAIFWPKSMYWRPGKPERFVRPVKWLVCLLDETILPVEFAGVRATNLSYGHRILHGGAPVTIARPAEYLSVLQSAFVIADAGSRRHRIRKALDAATRIRYRCTLARRRSAGRSR